MDPPSHDTQLRQAAFSHVDRLATLRGGVLDVADLAGGFEFGGQRIPLINPRRGIFKPRQMAHLLSIKTVFPRRGARVWYDDQREAHRQIYAGDDLVDYQFMGTDPNSPDNRWLRDAMEQQIPIIYSQGRLSSWFVRLCVKSGRVVTSGRTAGPQGRAEVDHHQDRRAQMDRKHVGGRRPCPSRGARRPRRAHQGIEQGQGADQVQRGLIISLLQSRG
jgi:hypothetical protein